MERRLRNYLNYIDELLTDDDIDNLDQTISDHLTQIAFFQHERLIHLIVTALFAILEMLAIMTFLLTNQIGSGILAIAILVLLIPYVRHYYILENGVQRLYAQWDELKTKKVCYKRKFD